MNACKSLAAPLVAGLVLTLLGCESQGGGRGRAAQFSLGSDKPAAVGQPGAKNVKNQTVALEADGDLSPEASIRRDLDRLRQKEKEQAKNIKEMKEAMAQGSEIIRKEEDRLADMRRQIERFESAQLLYQQTAGGGNGVALGNTGSAGPNPGEREPQYRTEPTAYSAADYGYAAAGGRRPGGQTARDYPDPRQLARGDGYAQQQYPAEGTRPEPAARAQPYAPQSRLVEEEPIWNPPERLFARTPAPARSVQQPRVSGEPLRPPAQPRRQAQTFPEKPVEPGAGTDAMNADVFVPDLFLSGEK